MVVRTNGDLWKNKVKLPVLDDDKRAEPQPVEKNPAANRTQPGQKPQPGEKPLAAKNTQPGQKPQPGEKPLAAKNTQSCQKPLAAKNAQPGQKPQPVENPLAAGLEHLHPPNVSKALVDTCRPRTPADIIGMERQVGDFMRWVDKRMTPAASGAKNEKYICLLAGPPGVGKTTAAYVVATHCDLRVIEIDASSLRTSADLKKYIREICALRASNGRRQMLLLEELDGAYDGATTNVVDIILDNIKEFHQAPNFPVIVATANNAMQSVLKKLRKSAITISFNRLKSADADRLITRCLSAANIKPADMTTNQRKSIVRSGGGDARQILYSLEMFALLKGSGEIQSHADRTFTSQYDVVATLITKRPDMWRELDHNLINGEPFVDVVRHNLVQNVNNFTYLDTVPKESESSSKMCMEAISDTLDDLSDAVMLADRAYLDRQDDSVTAIAASITMCSFDANGPSMFNYYGLERDHYQQPVSFSYPRAITRPRAVAAVRDGLDVMTKGKKK